jgi:hypothetical protein
MCALTVGALALCGWACQRPNPNALLDWGGQEAGRADGGDCGPNPCGACPPACAPVDRCEGGSWRCECRCPGDDSGTADARRAVDGKRPVDAVRVDGRRVDAKVAADSKPTVDSAIVAADKGPLGPEDCQNGFDDNGDGLVDCEDPKCQQGYQCVASPPAGWIGVGWVDGATTQPCPPPFQAFGLFEKGQLAAPPAACQCTCGTPVGTACRVPLRCVPGPTCTPASPPLQLSPGCNQVAVPAPDGANACSAGPLSWVGGSCAATAKAAVPPWSWPAAARGCLAASGGKCAGGQLCIAKLGGGKGPCIARAGDYSCPQAYPVKSLYYDGKVVDTRGCSSFGCWCGQVEGAGCNCSSSGCSVGIHAANNCQSGFTKTVPLSGACTTVNDPPMNSDQTWGALVTGVSLASPGKCPPSGAAVPVGSAQASGPVTVCCAL